jgi:uncharacterized membrane protein
MDEILKQLAANLALSVETIAAILIAYGALEALAKLAGHLLHGRSAVAWRKEMFVGFGVWLLLGLQFALAADILRSLISPTWNDIGQLAAIAAIRTFLNFFLEKDLSEAAEVSKGAIAPV